MGYPIFLDKFIKHPITMVGTCWNLASLQLSFCEICCCFWDLIYLLWLVVSNMAFIFHHIWDNPSH